MGRLSVDAERTSYDVARTFESPDGVYENVAHFKDPKGKLVHPLHNARRGTFVSLWPHERTPGERPGANTRFLFFNIGPTLLVTDLHAPHPKSDKVLAFDAHIHCHAVRPTDDAERVEVVVGLKSGKLVLVDTARKRTLREFNVRGAVTAAACEHVMWVPDSPGELVSVHADGNAFVFSVQCDDQDVDIANTTGNVFFMQQVGDPSMNPLSRWRLSPTTQLAGAFSPNGRYFAAVGSDGFLRVLDRRAESLVCGLRAYYGGLLCVAWSADSRYLLTGGEDDLVTLWSVDARDIVARGEGHRSYVSAVAFDDTRCGGGTYRFASVGHDTHLLLWEYSADTLNVTRRMSEVSSRSPAATRTSSPLARSGDSLFQAAPPRADVPMLAPLSQHRAHPMPLSDVHCIHNALITSCLGGAVMIWHRPGRAVAAEEELEDEGA